MQCVLCHTPMFYDNDGYVCPACSLKLYIKERNETNRPNATTAPLKRPAFYVRPDKTGRA